MGEIVRAEPAELTSGEIVEIIDAGGRVVIEKPILGTQKQVVIRKHGGQYYCDTPMKLLIHDSTAEILDCLEQFGLGRPSPNRDRPPARTVES